ncbi:GOLPH3/VPS74 family protein [Streptomyces meridianus]|uniref:GPP34 family phosphoprotein n=1 Tax=Streptomyces meridianus TaxID=2938945 RepID=A0ABT0XD08_9ACTN|nr:GPP34 family phosphoprotein [Streptomyces meridianus]MCM2580417.1 GPP34 family phosphoprotein [Streptomyces meridianus]
MNTPRDLMFTALDVAPSRPVEQGELSLALAGAELVDLLATGAVTLDGDRIVPGDRPTTVDRLLSVAAESLTREAPYESIEDWLWRRGRGLAAAYLAGMEEDGQLTRQRRGWTSFRQGRRVPSDSLDRRLAGDRWASDEPVLGALATAVGIGSQEAAVDPGAFDEPVETVLAAVDDATTELGAVRQRRDIEQAAFDNIWRGH